MAAQHTAPGQDPRNPRHAAAAHHEDHASVIRHEERLVIEREQAETGRARLRKYVVTEPVRQEVTLGSEEPDLVRTPITAEERQAFLDGRELPLGEDEVILSTAPSPWCRPCVCPTSACVSWPVGWSAPRSSRTPCARSAWTSRPRTSPASEVLSPGPAGTTTPRPADRGRGVVVRPALRPGGRLGG